MHNPNCSDVKFLSIFGGEALVSEEELISRGVSLSGGGYSSPLLPEDYESLKAEIYAHQTTNGDGGGGYIG